MQHPLKSFRSTSGLTMAALADMARTSEATICRIENGSRSPSLSLAARLSRVTGIPLDRFAPQEEAAE
jgi:transcriptional regulator with XRE-family HTH domain